MKLAAALSSILIMCLGTAALAQTSRGPAIIVSHYINDIRVDRTGGKVTIDTEIKLTDKTSSEFDSKCLELTSGLQASLKSIEDELLADNVFSMEVSKKVLPTGIKNSKSVCVVEITSKKPGVGFKELSTSLVTRADSENLDEVDPSVLKEITQLRKDAFVLNYFHAKHTYIPFKSFVEYLKVVPR